MNTMSLNTPADVRNIAEALCAAVEAPVSPFGDNDIIVNLNLVVKALGGRADFNAGATPPTATLSYIVFLMLAQRNTPRLILASPEIQL